MERYRRVYVETNVLFSCEGNMMPKALRWEDGRTFAIDKVLEVRRASGERAGSHGVRYTCRICGKERYLFYDGKRWFVEALMF